MLYLAQGAALHALCSQHAGFGDAVKVLDVVHSTVCRGLLTCCEIKVGLLRNDEHVAAMCRAMCACARLPTELHAQLSEVRFCDSVSSCLGVYYLW